MNNDRFEKLLDRYLANIATVEEQAELMSMIDEGSNDDAVRRAIDVMLANGYVDQTMDVDRAGRVLKNIVGAKAQSASGQPSQSLTRWIWYAAAAVLMAVTSAGWWLYHNKSAPVRAVAVAIQEDEQAVFKGKQFVHLPDGSTVLLNDGSRLSYSQTFGEQNREIALVGEAYFDVKHDPQKPFRVLTGKITTTVLGTTFNVTAYPEQREVKVTVTRGKVQVNSDNRLLGIITPDQQISVNTVTYDFVQRSVKAGTVSTWHSEYLILDDVSLAEAAKTIGRKYNVSITLLNAKLEKCRISATFLKGESLQQVLTVVSGVVQATYTIGADGNVVIDGKGCS